MQVSMLLLLTSLVLAAPAKAPAGGSSAPATAELTRLVNEFLAGASRNDAAVHDRFWADDLIYTGSSGRRIGKADIMRDVRSAPPPRPEDPKTTYSAEDVRIQQYGNTAIVAFRLVASTVTTEASGVARYLNTGTFVMRGKEWRAVAWQATRMPSPEDAARAEVSSATAALARALVAADTLALSSSLDERFVWTDADGQVLSRRELLDRLGSGQLRYSRFDPRNVAVALRGETAVATGGASWQRAATSGGAAASAGPIDGHVTLTWIGMAGDWKLMAFHAGR